MTSTASAPTLSPEDVARLKNQRDRLVEECDRYHRTLAECRAEVARLKEIIEQQQPEIEKVNPLKQQLHEVRVELARLRSPTATGEDMAAAQMAVCGFVLADYEDQVVADVAATIAAARAQERERCAKHLEARATDIRDNGPKGKEGLITALAGAHVGALLDAATELRALTPEPQ